MKLVFVNGISAFCTRSFIFHFLYMLNDTVEYDGYEDLFYYVNFLQGLANSIVVIPCGYKYVSNPIFVFFPGNLQKMNLWNTHYWLRGAYIPN